MSRVALRIAGDADAGEAADPRLPPFVNFLMKTTRVRHEPAPILRAVVPLERDGDIPTEGAMMLRMPAWAGVDPAGRPRCRQTQVGCG